MIIEITDHTIFRQIQHEFNTFYPYLWIDFFYHSSPAANQAKPEKINPDMLVRNLCTFEHLKMIDINSQKSVIQLETDFWQALGLKVKLLRKAGNVWVGTSYTGNWTLESQNSEGNQIDLD